jgi:glycerol kinase
MPRAGIISLVMQGPPDRKAVEFAPPPYVLALDQGTTSSRAILFDREARAVALAQEELPQSFPRPGWVEHDPEAIWETQASVVRRVVEEAGVQRRDVAAIGITNQRETTILWDRETGEAVHPAIVWQDRRTTDLCEALRAEGLEDLVRARTGLLLDPYFSATKLRWLLDHVPGARARAEAGALAFGTVETWLVHRLTEGKVHATDPSNASRTLLYDIGSRTWDDDLLAAFRVPRSVLPEVVPSSGLVAEARALLPGVPIAGIAGDQQAALFGQACFEAGRAKCTYGTGCFLLQHTGTSPVPSRHRLLTTVAWEVGGRTEYALEGSVFVGGALVQWLRDGLGLIRASEDVERLAASVPDAGGVVLVPAFAGLGAPHWDPRARGTIVGLTRGTTAAHVARAALDAIALQVADLLDAMHADSGLTLPELRVDGGAARNDLLMQVQADLLGIPVVRSGVTETTALGAAFLAGLAVGVWSDRAALARTWREDSRFEPRASSQASAALRASWTRAVERSRGWVE